MWPHSAAFLKTDGRLGILTSSTWLDTGYGIYLQRFLLEHFRIAAVLESECEPWFTGARVITAATLAQRELDARLRDDNIVRFVLLRKPLRHLLEAAGGQHTQVSVLEAAERVQRKLTEGPDADNADWRIRSIRQGVLRLEGEAEQRTDEAVDDEEIDDESEDAEADDIETS